MFLERDIWLQKEGKGLLGHCSGTTNQCMHTLKRVLRTHFSSWGKVRTIHHYESTSRKVASLILVRMGKCEA
jgi:hypothetical protein